MCREHLVSAKEEFGSGGFSAPYSLASNSCFPETETAWHTVFRRRPPLHLRVTPEADTVSGGNAVYVFALPQ